MATFSKLFPAASLREAFDLRVANAIIHRKQLHADIVEQLYETTNLDAFMGDVALPLTALNDVLTDMSAVGGKPYAVKHARLIHAVALAVQAVDPAFKPHDLPTWAEPKPKAQATPKAQAKPAIDKFDLLGSLGQLTDPALIQECLRTLQARASLFAKPAKQAKHATPA